LEGRRSSGSWLNGRRRGLVGRRGWGNRWSGLGSTGKGRAFLSIGFKIFDHQTDVEAYMKFHISL
jgi:hypothetical protein